ncbi:hypothetical protein [Corynebacterium epidermidicanis]|uniref:Uncharacterized protein n=1 Tax=Corynebacterium epidermidicanis TaxID=1050174 RepID=A0A0G3GV23_9CORY|nr:hypothetical protein [Corynebacterium epidermidicanis]AKK03383.1 hypothetical protein CEPID_07665 [Corynebacterium epidermidicanis]
MCHRCAPTPTKGSLSRRGVLSLAVAAMGVGAYEVSTRGRSVPAPTGPLFEEAQAVQVAAPVESLLRPLRPQDFAGRQPQNWGLSFPGIVSTVPPLPGKRTLALTFDACGGPKGIRGGSGLAGHVA